MNGLTREFQYLRRELKRRKVTRASVLYILGCWGALQVADIASPFFGFDLVAVSPILLSIAVAGFPIMLAFSWQFQVSSTGITRTPPFVERRVLSNLAPLNDMRRDALMHGISARAESSYDWVLEMTSGPLMGRRYGVEGDILVGRSPECHLTIPVRQVSRQHARFHLDGSRLLIEDLASSNGTSVNSVKIRDAVPLQHLDVVQILDVVIRVNDNRAIQHSQESTAVQKATLQDGTERQT